MILEVVLGARGQIDQGHLVAALHGLSTTYPISEAWCIFELQMVRLLDFFIARRYRRLLMLLQVLEREGVLLAVMMDEIDAAAALVEVGDLMADDVLID